MGEEGALQAGSTGSASSSVPYTHCFTWATIVIIIAITVIAELILLSKGTTSLCSCCPQ